MAGKAGAGAVWWDKPWLVAPNLTPDEEAGIASRTDDMLARAIREGVAFDGRVLHPQMWSSSFRRLSDEDIASVVVYLRSLKPIRNPLPRTSMPADVLSKLEVPEPLTSPMAAPDPADPIARGRYLTFVADCAGCHTSWYTPKNPGLFAGGNPIERGGRAVYSANITTDPSGIAHYDAAFFRDVMRTGRVKGRELSPLMPWIAFRGMTDADLDAIFAYLSALRPARHVIDNVNRPTTCAICGGTHPLGEYNKPRELRPIAYRLADVRAFAGTYRFEDGFELTFEISGGKLVLREGPGPDETCELITENGRHFFCRDGIDHVEFTRDASGRVTGLLNNGVDPASRR